MPKIGLDGASGQMINGAKILAMLRIGTKQIGSNGTCFRKILASMELSGHSSGNK